MDSDETLLGTVAWWLIAHRRLLLAAAVLLGAALGALDFLRRTPERRLVTGLQGALVGALVAPLFLGLAGSVAFEWARHQGQASGPLPRSERWPTLAQGLAIASPGTHRHAMALLASKVRRSVACRPRDRERAVALCGLGMPCDAAARYLRRCGQQARGYRLAERHGLTSEAPRRVTVEGHQGAVFPSLPAGDEAPWTPSDWDLRALESRLEPYLRSSPRALGNSVPPGLAEAVRGRVRQYSGHVTPQGRRQVAVLLFCRYYWDWRYEVVGTPSDGGDCFVSVVYDVATGTFSDLRINGDA